MRKNRGGDKKQIRNEQRNKQTNKKTYKPKSHKTTTEQNKNTHNAPWVDI